MNKRDLYKKYVETFGIKQTLLKILEDIGKLGIEISTIFATDTCPQRAPLVFNEKFHEGFASAHIALDQIIEMMGAGDTQHFLTQKHYQLNRMERAIWEKEKENEQSEKEKGN